VSIADSILKEGMQGHVTQVSVSRGGVPKYAVPEAMATRLGLEGDGHAHPRIHGGPQQALLLISAANIEALRARGWPLFPGALGENLTIEGLDFRQMRIGQRYRVGQALIEITKVRQPCATLDPYGPGIQSAILDRTAMEGDASSPKWGLSGFYASVSQPGAIRTGDIIVLLDQAV
jgi:MOSC domain-containing protein YiiM